MLNVDPGGNPFIPIPVLFGTVTPGPFPAEVGGVTGDGLNHGVISVGALIPFGLGCAGIVVEFGEDIGGTTGGIELFPDKAGVKLDGGGFCAACVWAGATPGDKNV